MMQYRIALLIIFFILITAINTGAAEQPLHLDIDDSYIRVAYETYPVKSAVELLISKGIPLSLIIDEAQKAGISDDRITEGLYHANLPGSMVILTVMQSHMSPRNVLRSLENQGVDPVDVLRLLVANHAEINRILITYRYLLNRGYANADLLRFLSHAGADEDTIKRVAMEFEIPPAILLEARIEIQDEIGPFGYVYNRHTLPKPALIAVGIARIHNLDPGKRNPISAKTP